MSGQHTYSMMTVMKIIVLSCLFEKFKCGRVKPFGSEFIVISNTNPNSISDYYFSMTFDTTLPLNGFVEIIFP